MKALSIKQPYAWAILQAGKTVENRTQEWAYRGPLLIHSSKTVLPPDVITQDTALSAALAQAGIDPAHLDRAVFPVGALLGVVTLLDTHHATGGCCTSAWAHPPRRSPFDLRDGLDTVHVVLGDPIVFRRPLPANGAPGLWDPPAAAQRLASRVVGNALGHR